MAIKDVKELRKEKQRIDLSGPQGNAYYLLGTASNLAKQIGLDEKAILTEMKSSDYENLLQVFDKYFGNFVDLYR